MVRRVANFNFENNGPREANFSFTNDPPIKAVFKIDPPTVNYDLFINKPKINHVELVGDKSLEDLGIITAITNLIHEHNISEDAHEYIRNLIYQETADREAADTILQQNIDEEARVRAEQDSVIREALEQEARIRTEQDQILQRNIEQEAQERQSTDQTLNQKILQETQTRQEADQVLQTNINNEAEARLTADQVLQTNINNEVRDREIADNTLHGQITSESIQREIQDNLLSGRIDSEVTARENADTALGNRIDSINELIPAEASPSNKLTDTAYVIDLIKTNAASYRGSWATWAAVPTNPNLYPADAQGDKTPTANDYMIVNADETRGGGTWMYKYVGTWGIEGKSGWRAEYEIGRTSFTPEQQAALDSGITSALVTQIGVNKSDIEGINTTLSGFGNIVTHNVAEFATASQGALADTAVQPEQLATVATTGSYNDLTDKPEIDTSDLATKEELNQKQNIITDLATIRTNASKGATAVQPEDLGDGTITFVQGDEEKGSITVNQKGDTTIYLDATGISGSAAWGNITGNIADQIDLSTALGNKVDKTSAANKVYGTDTNGDQTTYDVDSFGQVDDVTVGGTSVVTNKVAVLGSMAGETATDYATAAQGALADSAVQTINNIAPIDGNVTIEAGSGLNLINNSFELLQQDLGVKGVEVVGNLTKDGLTYSGFTSSDYLTIPAQKTLTGTDSYEIQFKFRTPGLTANSQTICFFATNYSLTVSSKWIYLYLPSYTSSRDIYQIVSSPKSNTEYIVNAKRIQDATGYTTIINYSTDDGETWTETTNSTRNFTCNNLVLSEVKIGRGYAGGIIYLDKSFIKVNGENWWNPLKDTFRPVARATENLYGLVKPDNSTITVNDGVISTALTDVQVNGTSVLSGGVANIPLATNSTDGVLHPSPSYGTTMGANGILLISDAFAGGESIITDKQNAYRPITARCIDLAVKVGVTTNTNTLTDTEKQNACNWIGAGQTTAVIVDWEG